MFFAAGIFVTRRLCSVRSCSVISAFTDRRFGVVGCHDGFGGG